MRGDGGSALGKLRARMAQACGDAEFARLGPGLDVAVRVSDHTRSFDIVMREGTVSVADTSASPDAVIEAHDTAWSRVLDDPAPPTFHAFTALELANPAFAVKGNALSIARARPTLERLFELATAVDRLRPQPVPRDAAQITGRYARIDVDGSSCCIYWESAGHGPKTPTVVFLHTAGADSRQFFDQLADTALADRCRLIAFDLPFHGRSMPPDDWDGGTYRLTEAQYLAWCASFIEQVVGDKVILAGCSMGAAIALTMAAERPDLLAGAIAIEPPFRASGRRNAAQHHVAVHGSLHNASFVRGLMSPLSPAIQRRRASWIYSQGAPGIYPGDLAFYSDEFDGQAVAKRIDNARVPVALLSGSYDYSASPEDGRKLNALMPDAYFREMPELGHFPMTEAPDTFRPYLIGALDHIVSALSA